LSSQIRPNSASVEFEKVKFSATLVLPDLIISYPTGIGSGLEENLFWDHRTICLMKLMLSAAMLYICVLLSV